VGTAEIAAVPALTGLTGAVSGPALCDVGEQTFQLRGGLFTGKSDEHLAQQLEAPARLAVGDLLGVCERAVPLDQFQQPGDLARRALAAGARQDRAGLRGVR